MKSTPSQNLPELLGKMGGTQLSPGVINVVRRVMEKRPGTPVILALLMGLALAHEMLIGADEILHLARNARPGVFNTLSKLGIIGVQAVAMELGLTQEDVIDLVKQGEAAAVEDIQAFTAAEDAKLAKASESPVTH